MKIIPLLTFLILYFSQSYSQIDGSSKINLENIIRHFNKKGTIVYTNKVENNIIERHFKYLNKSKIKGLSRDTKSNSIRLTKNERKYLVHELKKCTKPYWGDSLFTNSKRIELDSVPTFITNKKKEVFEFINDPKNIDSLKKNNSGYNWEFSVFEFSDIIYLRNRSIFLNYCMYYDGNGGSVDLYFYHKENGSWKRWILVSAGDF